MPPAAEKPIVDVVVAPTVSAFFSVIDLHLEECGLPAFVQTPQTIRKSVAFLLLLIALLRVESNGRGNKGPAHPRISNCIICQGQRASGSLLDLISLQH